MFGIEAPELLVILIVGLLVFGPDRLPQMARQAGAWVGDLRRFVANARRDLSDSIGVDPDDLRKLQNLNARSYVRRNVLDGLDLGLDDDQPHRRRPDRSAAASANPTQATPAATPFDPDTT
ncbi:MAG: twin-arginine translocase TatA/TatE family subunit [Jiangellaceae bacterium]|nr:twin-arginine translocase TatA/TatE family subunit [Jiangellaceae bacterium]